MKLTEAKSRIVAIQLGEAQLNFIQTGLVPIRAKFALISDEGSACGYFDKNNNWSDRTLAALQALAECMEQDALGVVFTTSSADPEPEKAEEPSQF